MMVIIVSNCSPLLSFARHTGAQLVGGFVRQLSYRTVLHTQAALMRQIQSVRVDGLGAMSKHSLELLEARLRGSTVHRPWITMPCVVQLRRNSQKKNEIKSLVTKLQKAQHAAEAALDLY